MIEIKLQIHHQTYFNVENLSSILKNVLESRTDIDMDFTDEMLLEWFERESYLIMPNLQIISTYWLRFEPFAEIKVIASMLNDSNGGFFKAIEEYQDVKIFKVIRLQDSLLLEKSLEYHREIADLEMRLREVLNYILHYDDRGDLSKSINDFNVGVYESYSVESAKEHFENQLFYFSFKHYAAFDPPKPFTDKEKIDFLTTVNDLDEFKNTLSQRKIKTERHVDFINSIKDKMDVTEKLRNAVMHNRAITKKTEGQYIKIRNDLRNEINSFWQNEGENQRTLLLEPKFSVIWLAPAKRKIEDILQNSTIWNIEDKTVEILDDEGEGLYENLQALQISFELIAEEEAELYMSTDEELKQEIKQRFDAEKLVLECLEVYREQIEAMGWEM